MSDYPNVRDCQHGQLRRSCERCADAAEIAALTARLVEVEAERDRAWRECSKAQDESSVWFNKRAAAEGRAAKERSGRLAAEARLAEVEQALQPERLAVLFHDTYENLAPLFGYETRRESAVPWDQVPEPNRLLMIEVARSVARAVLDKGEQG